MPICLIAAVSSNGVIGNELNEMPWEPLVEDLKNFRDVTTGNIIVMGAKTFESIGSLPLPHRQNVVFTRRIKAEYPKKGVTYVSSEVEFLNKYDVIEENIFIIGGAQLYNMFLPIADLMYLTQIDKNYLGNIKFPRFDKKEWNKEVLESSRQRDISFKFCEYVRKVL